MGKNEETSERKFIVKAPGKIIITGEHAVVYGKLALASSIDLFTELHLSFSSRLDKSPTLNVHFENLAFECSFPLEILRYDSSHLNPHSLDKLKSLIATYIPSSVDQSIEMSLLALFYLYCSIVREDSLFSVELRINSEIPIGAGLGSSAAFSVAASAAFHLLDHLIRAPEHHVFQADLEKINNCALNCEKIFHATPSGIDNAVCTYGGVVKFQEKVIGSLTIPEARILLVNSGKSRQTKPIVENVRRKRERLPAIVDTLLEAIDRTSHKLADLIIQPPEHNYNQIQELLTINHWLLASLGVSHPTLDDIHRIACSHGQAGKLTGAGGGGLAFIWLDPKCTENQLNALKEDLQSSDPPYQFRPACLGVKGLEIREASN